jgi:hypothetical protein
VTAMDMNDLSNFEDAIIKDIEDTITSTDAKVAIIDNLDISLFAG